MCYNFLLILAYGIVPKFIRHVSIMVNYTNRTEKNNNENTDTPQQSN